MVARKPATCPIRRTPAPNTFSRLVKQYELLKPAIDGSHKLRLAFAKAHANEMWRGAV